jgi:hypothetical protein
MPKAINPKDLTRAELENLVLAIRVPRGGSRCRVGLRHAADCGGPLGPIRPVTAQHLDLRASQTLC